MDGLPQPELGHSLKWKEETGISSLSMSPYSFFLNGKAACIGIIDRRDTRAGRGWPGKVYRRNYRPNDGGFFYVPQLLRKLGTWYSRLLLYSST
jgi:hypothetical protein